MFLFPIVLPIVLLASSSSINDKNKSNNKNNNKNIQKKRTMTTTKMSLQEQCERIAAKLENQILKKVDNDNDVNKQYWIGLGGGPGSGKSTAAERISKLLNDKLDYECSIVIPMDGWHIPQSQLLDRYGQENGMNRRGAPHTFDVELLYEQLSNAKLTGQDTLPEYSREISDPIVDAIQLKPTHQIVIVEGIYLLWKDDPNWSKIYTLWDEKWFIQCSSEEEQINRLLNRSIQTWTAAKSKIWGKGMEGAKKRINFNDVPNMKLVKHCTQYADEIIIND